MLGKGYGSESVKTMPVMSKSVRLSSSGGPAVGRVERGVAGDRRIAIGVPQTALDCGAAGVLQLHEPGVLGLVGAVGRALVAGEADDPVARIELTASHLRVGAAVHRA
jgi:hypothetical protein